MRRCDWCWIVLVAASTLTSPRVAAQCTFEELFTTGAPLGPSGVTVISFSPPRRLSNGEIDVTAIVEEGFPDVSAKLRITPEGVATELVRTGMVCPGVTPESTIGSWVTPRSDEDMPLLLANLVRDGFFVSEFAMLTLGGPAGPELVLAEQQAAPGFGPEAIVTDITFTSQGEGGAVYLLADVLDPLIGAEEVWVVWRWTSAGGFQTILCQSDAPPGVDPGLVFLDDAESLKFWTFPGGGMISAKIAGPANIPPTAWGIWAFDTSGLVEPVFVPGMPAPGGQPGDVVTSCILESAVNDVSIASLGTTDPQTGGFVLLSSQGDLRRVVGVGDVVPHTGETVSSVRSVTATGFDFAAVSTEIETEPGQDRRALLAWHADTGLELIAGRDDPIPGLGPEFQFSGLSIESDSRVFPDGRMVLPFATGRFPRALGILEYANRQLNPIIVTGDAPPGTPAGLTAGSFRALGTIASNAQGDVFYQIGLADELDRVVSSGDWIRRADGTTELVLIRTEPFDLWRNGTCESIDSGAVPRFEANALDDNGELLATIWLDSQVQSVLAAKDNPCPADTNGDGMLSPADYNGWILAYNSSAPACDQNGDGLCTPADFNGWILNFNAGC